MIERNRSISGAKIVNSSDVETSILMLNRHDRIRQTGQRHLALIDGALHPPLPFFLVHPLYGIREGDTSHLVMMQTEKIPEHIHAATFSHLAQQPADRLSHQIMRMMQMLCCISEGIECFTFLQRPHCTDHRDALFPKVGTFSQRIHNSQLL